jgi:molybdate transport system substrate-binding protein
MNGHNWRWARFGMVWLAGGFWAAAAGAALALASAAGAAPGKTPEGAAEVRVAVAANFTAAVETIGKQFERATGYRLLVSSGSSGKLVAQIQNGAPFDVFLSADAERPAALEATGAAVPRSRFTYAVGKLVLWSPRPAFVDARGDVLAHGEFAHLAIANPQTAPYGAAARQALQKLGLWERLAAKLVQGEDIAQTLQFVSSRSADLGFVALAQLRATGLDAQGSSWLVPQDLYAPIDQQAVLLTRAAANPAAAAFLDFLRGPAARTLIESLGYGLPAAATAERPR